MDEKGFISIEYIFSIFIILVVAGGLLFFSSSVIESSKDVEMDGYSRLILDYVANSISQVNSNGDGYSKRIELPTSQEFYKVTVDRNKVKIQYATQMGQSQMPLVGMDSKYEMYGGNSYLIEKIDGKIVIK